MTTELTKTNPACSFRQDKLRLPTKVIASRARFSLLSCAYFPINAAAGGNSFTIRDPLFAEEPEFAEKPRNCPLGVGTSQKDAP
jgi:hypothetical protein